MFRNTLTELRDLHLHTGIFEMPLKSSKTS